MGLITLSCIWRISGLLFRTLTRVPVDLPERGLDSIIAHSNWLTRLRWLKLAGSFDTFCSLSMLRCTYWLVSRATVVGNFRDYKYQWTSETLKPQLETPDATTSPRITLPRILQIKYYPHSKSFRQGLLADAQGHLHSPTSTSVYFARPKANSSL